MNEAYNIDCVQGMKQLPDNLVDLTVTSPPYDAIRDYNGYTFDYESVLREIYRVTKDGGVCVWIVSDQTKDGSESGTSFKQALYAMSVGFNLHDTMIWKKDSCAFPESTRYYPNFEYMFVFSKSAPKTFNPIEDRINKWGGGKSTRNVQTSRRESARQVNNMEGRCLQGIWRTIQRMGDAVREEQYNRAPSRISICVGAGSHHIVEQRERYCIRSVPW